VPGRFEQVRAGQPFLFVVDYRPHPDALERVLTTARKLTGRRLVLVFGSAATAIAGAPYHGRHPPPDLADASG